MSFKILISVLIIVANSISVLGQNEFARCAYRLSTIYYCDFTIFNPRGVNNFHTINGTHITTSYTDAHVNTLINLSGSETTIVPTIICEKFINLQRLTLCDLRIENLDLENESSFKKCFNILYIELCRNNISDLSGNLFGVSTRLQELRLWDSGVKNVSEIAFINLYNLTTLWLNGNQIVSLPLDVFKPLENLRTLNLNDNKIVTLKFQLFQHLRRLETLHLQRNKITTVVSFDVAVPMYYLYLNENLIKYIPEKAFNPFQTLNTLHLHNNTFEIIHSNAFGNMPNLRTLRLDNNNIKAFDQYFLNITGVMYLNMTRNVCANEHIFDNSTTRFSMRVILAECIDNYENYGVGELVFIFIDHFLIFFLLSYHYTVTTTSSTQMTSIENITNTPDPNSPQECSIGSYDDRICNLEKELAAKTKIFQDAIDELQNKYYELLNRPCTSL